MNVVKKNKGITLISLIVTIIVLLILAGVTISQITGSENAMEKATQAREENKLAEELEQIKLCVLNSISKGLTGLVTDNYLREELNGKVKNIVTNADSSWTIEANSGAQFKITSGGIVTEVLKVTDIQAPSEVIEVEQGSSIDLSTKITTIPSSNIENLKYTRIGNNEKVTVIENTGIVSVSSDATVGDEVSIEISGSLSTNVTATCKIKVIQAPPFGTPQNTQFYGNDVSYSSANGTTAWKLFYQNEHYTYLISTELKGSYKLPDYYSTYTNESFEQTTNVAKKLNPLLLAEQPNLFTNEKLAGNMKAMAWMCDTNYWKGYTSDNSVASYDGSTSYAVMSPSIELFIASYNSDKTDENYTALVTPSTGINGYINSWSTYNILSSVYNNGIYTTGENRCWLVSGSDSGNVLAVSQYSIQIPDISSSFSRLSARPIVCIPNSNFDNTKISGYN